MVAGGIMPRYQLISSKDPDPVAGFDTIGEARENARRIAENTKYISGGIWYVMRVSDNGYLFTNEVFSFHL
jgi:hypothetical protein